MNKESILFAKVAALKKSFENIDFRLGRCSGSSIEPLLPRYEAMIKEIKNELSNLYSDIPDLPLPRSIGNSTAGSLYEKRSIDPLINNLDYILEVRTNFRIGETDNGERSKRIFISHGQSKEWYKIQEYIEKDLKLLTLELAQEPILGRTVLQKLNDEAGRCGYAVIVMTGDDVLVNEVRARENVMHEIGFFQGKYGLQNVTLLHEKGVNMPSNIHGLVYIPFPKDTVEATFGALNRELKAQLL